MLKFALDLFMNTGTCIMIYDSSYKKQINWNDGLVTQENNHSNDFYDRVSFSPIQILHTKS